MFKVAFAMTAFPPDENGDVLRRMVEHRENLIAPRDIDFVVVVPYQRAANLLLEEVTLWGFGVTIECA